MHHYQPASHDRRFQLSIPSPADVRWQDRVAGVATNGALDSELGGLQLSDSPRQRRCACAAALINSVHG